MRDQRRRVVLLLIWGVIAVASDASRADESTLGAGQRLFQMHCAACHSINERGFHGIGPNLWNVFGSRAAAKSEFYYSPALQQSGIVWSEELMDRWLADPAELVPDNGMALPGITIELDRSALVAFLKHNTTSTGAK